MILALDTATLTASVALADDRGRALASGAAAVRTHSEQLLPLLDQLLAGLGASMRDVRAIACGAGPGSFTGLRIGLATAKGLAFATGAPLYLVSSLEALVHAALAAGAARDALLVPCVDARKREVFLGFHRAGRQVAPEMVCTPERMASSIAEIAAREHAPVVLFGEGAQRYREHAAVAAPIRDDLPATPPATSIAALAHARRATDPAGDPVASAAPTYIRPPEITPPRPKSV